MPLFATSSSPTGISIHAPREGSDRAARGESRLKAISIHAPREGSDLFRALGGGTQRHFYPRSPRGERLFIIIFFRRRRSYFYPRSPRGERPTLWILQISRTVFLSTLPARGATRRPRAAGPEQRISIHAPREGSDPKSGSQGSRSRNFYPRSPRGERQYTTTAGDRQAAFLSTLPARGATLDRQREAAEKGISIHAPREGSDRQRAKAERQSRNFYPRSPRGERHLDTLQHIGLMDFYPRSPRGERHETLF